MGFLAQGWRIFFLFMIVVLLNTHYSYAVASEPPFDLGQKWRLAAAGTDPHRIIFI